MSAEELNELEKIFEALGELHTGNPDADSIIYSLWERLESLLNNLKK